MKKDKKSKKNNDSKERSKKQKKSSSKKERIEVDPNLLRENLIKAVAAYRSHLTSPRCIDGTLSLYPSELATLKVIHASQRLNLTQLAAALSVSKSAATKSSNKLIEKKLVSKVRSSESSREVAFSLTDAGQAISASYEAEQTEFKQAVEGLIKGLKPSEQAAISQFMAELTLLFKPTEI